MVNGYKEDQATQSDKKLLDDCRAFIANGSEGHAAAVSMYRLAKQCSRQAAMHALGLL